MYTIIYPRVSLYPTTHEHDQMVHAIAVRTAKTFTLPKVGWMT